MSVFVSRFYRNIQLNSLSFLWSRGRHDIRVNTALVKKLMPFWGAHGRDPWVTPVLRRGKVFWQIPFGLESIETERALDRPLALRPVRQQVLLDGVLA